VGLCVPVWGCRIHKMDLRSRAVLPHPGVNQKQAQGYPPLPGPPEPWASAAAGGLEGDPAR